MTYLHKQWQLFFILILFTSATTWGLDNQKDQPSLSSNLTVPTVQDMEGRTIIDIKVEGNQYTPTSVILSFVPYKIGESYSKIKTRELISHLYFNLRRFRIIRIELEPVGTNKVIIHVVVEEKHPLKEIIFEGNKHLNTKEIRKQLNLDTLAAIDSDELKPLSQKIKKLYLDKGYHTVLIEPSFVVDEENRASAYFSIKEGKQSLIKRITFVGNHHMTDKELRSVLLSKEDWLLGFMDKAGSYHPERIAYGDKQFLEQHYQNRGFIQARVLNIETDIAPHTKDITLTFHIEEGDQYTISAVEIEDHPELPAAFLKASIPLQPGMLYSRELIAQTIKQLELLWGNAGYIFTHVEPIIIPDPDNKTVTISFVFDIGSKVKIERVNIRGNKKTRDKVIRRKIFLQEGSWLTTGALERTKQHIQTLGFFDVQDGVVTKIRRIDSQTAEVDVIVKEIKTGHIGAQIGFGGAGGVDLNSPASGFTVKADVADTNFWGSGINLNVSASWAKEEQTLLFHIAQPWLFDRPILGALDVYHRRPTYTDLRHIDGPINEKLTGGAVSAGFITQSQSEYFHEIQVLNSLGIDSIRYQKQPIALVRPDAYQPILNKAFTPGDFLWLANYIERDTRNHPIHPNHGNKWKLTSKVAIPTFGNNIGYYKMSLETNWYTSLIDEYNLVLRIHTYFGLAIPFKNRIIPFSELFHIGGDTSVRGFNFGQIGPKFFGDSIGAKKAMFLNVELIFPITSDYSMKGVLFYDGGTGWDNPYADDFSRNLISHNGFDYRHSVGVGLRLLKPMPIKIDWGFKIDPRTDRLNRRHGESSNEVHFGMSYDW